MSGGPYVVRKVTGDTTAFGVTETELNRCEEEVVTSTSFERADDLT